MRWHKNLAKVFGIVYAISFFCITNTYAKSEISAWVGVSKLDLKNVNGLFAGFNGKIKIKHSNKLVLPIIGLEYMHDICNNYKMGASLGVMGKRISFINEETNRCMIECTIVSVPMMLGGCYNKDIGEKVSLNGKVFLGYTFVDLKSTKEVNKTSGCFISDISVGGQYMFTKRFGAGLDVGYRFATDAEIEDNIKLNFSGIKFALNLSCKV
jgi:hypothetical protein